ncbi:nucleotidyltransferase domain-containing protein [Streptomyces sp. NPDC003300]|uniref:nucleotidyltransferase domain-containing protein n=1 Tax=unclassified Streptomyces TaxID=2593676 RepID=UPI0033A70EF6
MEPTDAAHAVVKELHPDARAAFLCGGVITDRRTATSDLDIVIVLDGEPAPYRLSVHRHGWPVELFVHTEETWHAFIEREVPTRRCPLMWMCAGGTLLFDTDRVGARIKAHAESLVAAGPPPTPVEEIENRRYALTDLLDDLTSCTDPGERLFISTEIARRTAELTLAVHNTWNGGGKWLARRLDTAAPGLTARLHTGVQQALDGRTARLIAIADEALNQAGGRLWAGYHRSGKP